MRIRWAAFLLAAGCTAGLNHAAPADLGAAPGAADGGLVTTTTNGSTTTLTAPGPLRFAVFGDARPPSADQTAAYPTTIVEGLFALAARERVQFVVGTGDYMFANHDATVQAQLDLLLSAEKAFSGPVLHALGNHECTGGTASNCPTGMESPNVRGFMAHLVPAGTPTPYYRVDVATPMGSAKLLFVAANGWSDAQDAWLRTQLADATPYTFVIRHEPSDETRPPGVIPSDAALQGYSPTLLLYGHYHRYEHTAANQVICGNGGAPLSSSDGSVTYGLLLIEQQPDGNIAATELDEADGNPVDTWRVTPTGQAVN